MNDVCFALMLTMTVLSQGKTESRRGKTEVQDGARHYKWISHDTQIFFCCWSVLPRVPRPCTIAVKLLCDAGTGA